MSRIIGIGTDLVDARRIESLMKGYPTRFFQKIFTPQEVLEGDKRGHTPLFYAKRFAAKEAFSKALGIGIGVLSWQDIWVENDPAGKPFFKKSEALQKRLETLFGNHEAFLSLSDESPYAQAFVVLTTQ